MGQDIQLFKPYRQTLPLKSNDFWSDYSQSHCAICKIEETQFHIIELNNSADLLVNFFCLRNLVNIRQSRSQNYNKRRPDSILINTENYPYTSINFIIEK